MCIVIRWWRTFVGVSSEEVQVIAAGSCWRGAALHAERGGPLEGDWMSGVGYWGRTPAEAGVAVELSDRFVAKHVSMAVAWPLMNEGITTRLEL